MKNVKTLLILSLFAINGLFAQTVFEQDAYFSNLNSFQFFNKDIASFIQIPEQWNDQQFHLRWNMRLYHEENWTAKMSLRNRIFTGYSWEENLFGFKDGLDEDPLDLIAINENKIGMHHQRYYLAKMHLGFVNFQSYFLYGKLGIQCYHPNLH